MKQGFGGLASAVILSLAAPDGAMAGPFEDATAAYEAGDYAAAIVVWRSLAEQGDAEAQQAVGFMYDLGCCGVQQDFLQAADRYRRAAAQGSAHARFRLGYLYEGGLGVPHDAEEATRWYQLAAEQGLVIAQGHLAQLYLDGNGVPQSYQLAMDWARNAALGGDQSAAGLLSSMYFVGRGVHEDRQEAQRWMQIQADDARRRPPLMSAGSTAPPLTPEQLAVIVDHIEQATGLAHAGYVRYYEPVLPHPPSLRLEGADYGQYKATIDLFRSLKPEVRGIYLRGVFSAGTVDEAGSAHVVPEGKAPLVLDGGCSVKNLVYDVAAQSLHGPTCGGR